MQIEIRVEIDSTHHFAVAMSDLVLFATGLCSSEVISSSTKLKHYRSLCTLARRLTDVLLSQSLTLPIRTRSEALSVILRASSLLFSLQGCAADVVDMIPTIILLARLREGPNTGVGHNG